MLFILNLWESFIWYFWASVLLLYVDKFVKMQVSKIGKWSWTRVALHQLPSLVHLGAMGWYWRSSVICLRVRTFLHCVALVGTALHPWVDSWSAASSLSDPRRGVVHNTLSLFPTKVQLLELNLFQKPLQLERRAALFFLLKFGLMGGALLNYSANKVVSCLNNIQEMPPTLYKVDREISCGCLLLTLTQWAPHSQIFGLKEGLVHCKQNKNSKSLKSSFFP